MKPSLPDIGRRISKYRKDSAVVLDYDGVLTPSDFPPAIELVRAYNEAGHLGDDVMDEFEETLENRDSVNDREFEGSLLFTATRGLEGTDKGELRSTTSDFVAEHRNEVLTEDANNFLAEQQSKGRDTYIVSNNYRLFFEPLADNSNVNINHVYANVLGVEEDPDNGNILDGTLSQSVYEGKEGIAETIVDDRHIYAAVGDTASDFPLLERAENAYGVSPTEEFLEKKDSGWQVEESLKDIAEDLRRKDRPLWQRWLDI